MTIHIESKYDIGDIVYLKTDSEAKPRVITQINIIGGGVVLYMMCQGTMQSGHYASEIVGSPSEVLVSVL